MWGWDEAKRQANLAKHGVDFADVMLFDWDTALIEPAFRTDYGELRMRALGLMGERVHLLVFTKRFGNIRVISLRKANLREARRWANREK